MNNTTQAARQALARADEMLSSRYNFDGPGWNGGPMHEVNVKRYSDYMNDDTRDAIATKAAATHSLGADERAQIREYVDEYTENDDAYWQWIAGAWEQLNYEASEREYKHIREHAYPVRRDDDKRNNPMIVSRGRMGGHACFNSDVESLADELGDILDDYEHGDPCYTAHDVRDATRLLLEACDEVEHLQAFIKQYNKGLSWKDELEYRAHEYASEMRAAIDQQTRKRKAQIQNNAPLLSR